MYGSVPTDEEYLKQIYESLKDDDYIRAMSGDPIKNASFYEQHYRDTMSKYINNPNQLEEEVKGYMDETNSLDLSFSGDLIKMHQKWALRILGHVGRFVKEVPVGLLPTRELNACAIATPRGGSIIIINFGTLMHLHHFVQSFLSFYFWYSDTPFCRDHSQKAFAKIIVALVKFSITGDYADTIPIGFLLHQISPYAIPLSICPTRPRVDDTVGEITFFCVQFILLHEYTHVLLGDLRPKDAFPAKFLKNLNLKVYKKSLTEEFDADALALQKLIQFGKYIGARPSDCALYVGLMFKYFELSEILLHQNINISNFTHPPASDRWQKIKDLSKLYSEPHSIAFNLDSAFESIIQIANGQQIREWRPKEWVPYKNLFS